MEMFAQGEQLGQNLREKCQTSWVCQIHSLGNHCQEHYHATANHLITLTMHIKTTTKNILKAAIQYQKTSIFCHYCAFKLKTVENYYIIAFQIRCYAIHKRVSVFNYIRKEYKVYKKTDTYSEWGETVTKLLQIYRLKKI